MTESSAEDPVSGLGLPPPGLEQQPGAAPDAASGLPLPPPPPVDPAPWGLKGAVIVTALSLLAQLVLAVVLGALAYAALATIEPNILSHPDELKDLMVMVTITPLALLSSVFTVGLVYLSITWKCRRPFFESLKLRRPVGRRLFGFLALGCLLALVYVLLSSWLPMPPQETEGPLSRLAQSGPVGHALWALLAMVMAPVVEEILFRGYAYLGARQALGPGRAGAAVTVIFVILHTTETGGYWPALAGIATLATILILVFERTNNLTYCIACHLGYNAALASLSFLVGVQ